MVRCFKETGFQDSHLSDKSNVYGVIFAAVSKIDIAQKFQAEGWSVRKSSWTGFEVACKWAALNLDGEGDILIHGAIHDTSFEKLEQVLHIFDVGFSIELYNNNNELIKAASRVF